MTLDQDTVLVLAGIGVGLLVGLIATLLQIRRDPEAWNMLSRKPVASVPGSGSSVAALILGFAFLLVGIVLSKNPVMMTLGAAVFAFGAIRYLFRYYRPL
jgi:hypothetical protein